ncbi:MAG: glycerol-3-phosphate acyltransferase, partial [Bacillota bacterium]|nr:glycerol-3-phosphate acyltransferase [Bacillota bacterium]
MQIIIYVLLSFLSGAIPYSLILGKVFLKKDIRDYGDGNPGAANAWKAGGSVLGLASVLMDVLKAFLPVYYALVSFNIPVYSPSFVAIAIAPVAGHAFSPFLSFRGGKAVASTYGIWLALYGLTDGLLVMALGSAFFFILQTIDAWTVVLGMVSLMVYLFLSNA